ncbi:sugar ABC transporter substrate-binding protein [Paenibacillus sp. 598K]|uniref:ABC transporter substrate-binding protein n=1 Tax=Paenibacillus sp. 598K TaxID=1117987 RepID=UPI000FF9E8A4|nr:ABC transporter substrate-binding protein [Paenibacillus sp. 598K]GBF77321.1 sugar ABC transporter substrate-binding protein [Paenibacillus sp. 598K]
MERSKRVWMTMMLTICMVVGLALAGCSSNQEASTSTQSSSSENSDSPSSQTEQPTELEPVKLVWYLRAPEPNNAASVIQKANEMIQSKINATVDFKFVNPGDYNNKMQLVMSSGEEYDIAFTSNWANPYVSNATRGAYVPVDDLLAQYPDLKNSMRQEVWDGVRVNGKIYGIPNNQIMATAPGIWFKKDLLDKYQIDATQFKSLEDWGAAYEKIKAGEPDVSPLREGIPTAYSNSSSPVDGTDLSIDPNTWQVYYLNYTLTDRFKIMRDWYQKGYFPQDVATLKDEVSLIKAEKIFSRYYTIKPGAEAEFKANYGFDIVIAPTNSPRLPKAAGQTTMNAISTTSKNQERAMMLINLLHTDKELFNLLKFGIEGQDYTKVSDNRIEPKADAYSLSGWILGNEFNSYVIPGQTDDVWEQTKELNDSAQADPTTGFTFNTESVQNEIAQLSAVTAEFLPILKNGMADIDQTMEAMKEKRKAAGEDKVIAEAQRQLDEWLKTKQ